MNMQSSKIQRFIYDGNSRLSFMHIIGGIFATSSHALQSKRNFCRFLWIIFLLFGIIMRSLHQATLFKFLQNNQSEIGVKSVDEVLKKNFTIYSSKIYENLVEDERNVKFKFVNNFNLKDLKKFLNSEENNLFLTPLDGIPFYNQKYFQENHLKFLKCPFYTFPVFFMYRENFKFKNDFDVKIGEFQAAGLTSFWKHKIGIEKDILIEKINLKDPSILTLNQLLIVFKILVIGCILSILVFSAEITYFKLTKS